MNVNLQSYFSSSSFFRNNDNDGITTSIENNKFRVLFLILGFSFLAFGSFAQPTITSFSPTSGEVGDAVTITGTNFDATPANNAVYFGSVLATINTASTTSLDVTVPARSTYEPITVINKTTNLVCQSSLPFQVTNSTAAGYIISSSSFAAAVDITSAENNTAVLGGTSIGDVIAVADFDGDGKPDVAKVSNSASSDVVNVRRNVQTVAGTINTSSFTDAGDFAIANDGYSISVADFDGDGKIDIVAVCGTTASFLRNTSTSGTISFAARVDLAINSSSKIRAADIDGDGKIDIIVGSGFASTYYVYLNTSTSGSISFSASATSVLSGTSGGRHFTVGDLDDDGLVDLIMPGTAFMVKINSSTSGSVSFGSAVDLSFASGWYSCIGDFTGDSKIDILSSPSIEHMFVNDYVSGSFGSGDVTAHTPVETNTGFAWCNMGDFTGDGKLDYIVGDQNAGSRVIFRQSIYESGTISSSSFNSFNVTASDPRHSILVDIDGDNLMDIVSSSSTNAYFQVFKNDITSGVLPVALTNFEVKWHPEKAAVLINWETASETNNNYFIIERSVDGQDWEEIDRSIGNSNSSEINSYEAIDDHPIFGGSYYRLQQIDFDGTINYSPVKYLLIHNDSSRPRLYPNPSSDKIIISDNNLALSTLKIYNITGEDVTAFAFVKQNSADQIEIDISKLPSGNYFVKSNMQTHRFTKLK